MSAQVRRMLGQFVSDLTQKELQQLVNVIDPEKLKDAVKKCPEPGCEYCVTAMKIIEEKKKGH